MKKGTIYLLHFHKPYKHARHYLGWTSLGVEDRLERHRSKDGARLLQVLLANGIEFTLARTWEGTRDDERRLKNRKSTPRLCPICNKGGDTQ